MIKRIISFFDVLEDKVRGNLSEKPIVYAVIASVGTVLLWRGIWMTADIYNLSGPASILVGLLILLVTGLFVSGFIGNRIILTGMRKEKKLTEKTKDEIEEDMMMEKQVFHDIQKTLGHIEEEIKEIKNN